MSFNQEIYLTLSGLSQAGGQTVNPLSTKGPDYAHHSTYYEPPGFSDLATAALLVLLNFQHRAGHVNLTMLYILVQYIVHALKSIQFEV